MGRFRGGKKTKGKYHGQNNNKDKNRKSKKDNSSKKREKKPRKARTRKQKNFLPVVRNPAIAACINATLSPGTRASYESTVDKMGSLGYECSASGVAKRISEGKPQKLGTYYSYIYATEFILRRCGICLGYSAETKLFLRRLARGRALTTLQITAQRGAITLYMLNQLLAYMKSDLGCSDRDCDMVRFIWATGSRSSEVKGFTWSQLRRTANGSWSQYCEKIHEPLYSEQRMGVRRFHYRYIHPEIYEYLNQEWNRSTAGMDDLIFPEFSDDKVRGWVAKAAVHLRWSKYLEWVAHSLRHGVALELAQTLGVDAAQACLGHEGEECTLRYTRTNKKRLEQWHAEVERALKVQEDEETRKQEWNQTGRLAMLAAGRAKAHARGKNKK